MKTEEIVFEAPPDSHKSPFVIHTEIIRQVLHFINHNHVLKQYISALSI